jgi:soluble lytic murein transglycosylase
MLMNCSVNFHSAPDKEIALNMSSMVKHLISVSALIFPAIAFAQAPQDSKTVWQSGTGNSSISAPKNLSDPTNGNIPSALKRWRELSASGNYSFSDYASFLITYPDWPGSNVMRKNAEQAIDLNSYSPSQAVAYFDRLPPVTNSGTAKYALALAAVGDTARAAEWGRKAWRGGPMTDDDETRILSLMNGKLNSDDFDARAGQLLTAKATRAAGRAVPYTSAARRPVFAARLAMQAKAPDAEAQFVNAGQAALTDAGAMAERAKMLRRQGSNYAAWQLFANRPALARPASEPDEWYEVLLVLARDAATNGQNELAYRIASKLDDGLPAGTNMIDQSLGVRDDYTSLAWLGGTVALDKLRRPREAAVMFDRYGKAAKSPQTRTKGMYWAGYALRSAGDTQAANAYFNQAAGYFDQFYGQLSNEALGRPLPARISGAPIPSAPSAANSSLYLAAKLAGTYGTHSEQTLFLRTIANGAKSEQNYIDAIALSKNIGRPDLAVMAGRNARVDGFNTLIPYAFPIVGVPVDHKQNFTFIHAIARQESQFDREAVSHAGARGLMQLMPGTARETSGKISMGYSLSGLTNDPIYNIRLGSTYFKSMLRYFNNSYPLAVAAYNAGPGNVNKWLRANGDPRTGQISMLQWIERIPIYETKNYVQRVLENAVIYDLQHPETAAIKSANPLSTYLGKSTPG